MYSKEHQGETQKKLGKTLPLWGNAATMNINSMVHTNVLGSPYFKNQLIKLKTYHEVVDEIFFKVDHLEPWEKGSRKTSGQVGMCGGVRGVGAGGIVSTAFCLLFKLFTLKLTRKQLKGLLDHPDSPFIRGLGFMYIRFCQPPQDYWHWYEEYLEDEEELDVKSGSGCVMTIGQLVRSFMLKLDWYGTLFPRIPVPIQKELQSKLSEVNLCDDHKRKADETWGEAERYSKGVRDASQEDTNDDDRKNDRDTDKYSSRNQSRERSRDRESSSRHRDSPRQRSRSRDRQRRRDDSRDRKRSRSRDVKSSRQRSRSREKDVKREKSRNSDDRSRSSSSRLDGHRSRSNDRHRSRDRISERSQRRSPVEDRRSRRSNSRDRPSKKQSVSRSPPRKDEKQGKERHRSRSDTPPSEKRRKQDSSPKPHDNGIHDKPNVNTTKDLDEKDVNGPLTDEFGRDIRPSASVIRASNTLAKGNTTQANEPRTESKDNHSDKRERDNRDDIKLPFEQSILHGVYNSDSGEDDKNKQKDNSPEDGELIEKKKKKSKKEKKSKKHKHRKDSRRESHHVRD